MRNKNGENWSKYLKEINELQPMLNENMKKGESGLYDANGDLVPINDNIKLTDENGAILMTRAEKRRMDRKVKKKQKKLGMEGDREYLQRNLRLDKEKSWLKRADSVTHNKQEKINLWFDEELRMLLGSKTMNRISKYIQKHGKWPWWRRYIKCKIEHSQKPYPWGTDYLAITIFGRLHAAVEYVWEDK